MTTAIISRGNSRIAQYLDNASQSIGQYFHQSAIFSKQPAYEELVSIWEECQTPNWDGDGAFPIQEATFTNAYFFCH